MNVLNNEKIALFWIKILANSRNNKIFLDPDGNIICELKAKPIKGEANKLLIKYLSKKFSISSGNIHIEKGFKSNNKLLKIIGYNTEELKIIITQR